MTWHNLQGPSAVAFFGGAQQEILLNNSSQLLSPEFRVWSFDSANGAAQDRAVLPDQTKLMPGSTYFLLINTNALLIDFGVYDSDGTTLLASVARDEAVIVDLALIGGLKKWVVSKPTSVTKGSPPAVSVSQVYYLHGTSGTTGTPVAVKSADRYDPLRKSHATTTSSSSFDSLKESSAAYVPGLAQLYLVGTTAGPTHTFLRFDVTPETWPSVMPTGPSWLSTGRPVYAGGYSSGAVNAVYEFGGVSSFGYYIISTGTWVSLGTGGSSVWQGTGISALFGTDLYAFGTTPFYWYESTKMDIFSGVFTRLSMTPSRTWKGSGGLIGAFGEERVFGYASGAALYNPYTDTWANKVAYPGTNDKPGGASYDGSFYSVGGTIANSSGAETRSWDMLTDSWAVETSMAARRTDSQQSAATA